ncbi:MAG: hypothetical protein ACFB4I_13005 [Cyanophyceae cyanobacterium]
MFQQFKSLRRIAVAFLLLAAATVILERHWAIANSPSTLPPHEETMFRFENFDRAGNDREIEQAIKKRLLDMHPIGSDPDELIESLEAAEAYCRDESSQDQEFSTHLCRYRYPLGIPVSNPRFTAEAFRSVTIYYDETGIVDIEVSVAHTA